MPDASEQNCGNCRFYKVTASYEGGSEGRCRRYPPNHHYQETVDFEWCGEWKMTEEAAIESLPESARSLIESTKQIRTGKFTDA